MEKESIEVKRDGSNLKALEFCASHGRTGGGFDREVWANGEVMIGVNGSRQNQFIRESEFLALVRDRWSLSNFSCSA